MNRQGAALSPSSYFRRWRRLLSNDVDMFGRSRPGEVEMIIGPAIGTPGGDALWN
jgi:hypothetical protein